MKTLIFTITVLLICSPVFLFAQDKTPIAEDDYYDAFSLRTDTLRPLENDFAWDDHPFKLLQVFTPFHGEVDWDDSLVYYTPDMYFKGMDSVKYRILDTENMLMSELATVYLQVGNKSFDTLQINNIHCRINSCGVQFNNVFLDDFEAMFEVPANSGISAVFSQSLWLGGFDQDNNLHMAGDIYRRDGIDFFPGPVLDPIEYNISYDISWNRVWMLYQSDIDYHRSHFQDVGYELIKNIREWPAVLDPTFAPFIDIDGNGLYNPENGDFPLIKGDQAIYFIFNDDRGYHFQTYGEKMGAEIHAMYYAYDRPDDSTLNNTVFASCKIINKSENDYHDFFIGLWNDFDIGCPTDDYLGTDTLLNSFYGYNSTPIDCSYQYPANYGLYPPAASITALNFNISSSMAHYYWINATSFPVYPSSQYYNYLKAIWKDSTHLTVGGIGYDGDEPTMFIYPGDPVTGEGWSEVSANNESYDISGLVSTGPFNLTTGECFELDFALVFARDYTGGGFAHLNSVNLLKERIAEVHEFYEESFGDVELLLPQMEIEVYPNPFADFVTIETASIFRNLTYSVFDILGEMLVSGIIQNNNQSQINLKKLNNGIYFIRVFDGETFVTRKIIKQ